MKKMIGLLATGMLAMSAAQAATISFSNAIADTTTNWAHNLTLQQFDGSLGTLQSVKFTYAGHVNTTFREESLDAAPATITVTASAAIAFALPVGQTLNISNSNTQNVGAFDGTIDFAGASGFGPLLVTGTDSGMLTLVSGLGAFVGLGTYNIGVTATGTSGASGAGNLISQINTTAGANITVDYTYAVQHQTPEPASLALAGLALAGIALTARRRKQG